jgi:hypothetical protein
MAIPNRVNEQRLRDAKIRRNRAEQRAAIAKRRSEESSAGGARVHEAERSVHLRAVDVHEAAVRLQEDHILHEERSLSEDSPRRRR